MGGWMNGFLTEGAKLILAAPPQTINGAALDSLYVKTGQYRRFLWLVLVGDRAGATTPNVTFTQATSNAGAGGKTLSFDTAFGVDGVAQTVDKDTLAALAVVSDAVPLSANDFSLLAVNIRVDQLDINNGFMWHKLSVASPGANAVPICVLCIAYAGDHVAKESTLPSLLA